METPADEGYVRLVLQHLTPLQRALLGRVFWQRVLFWEGLTAEERRAVRGCGAFVRQRQVIALPGGQTRRMRVVVLSPLGQAVQMEAAYQGEQL